MTISVSISPIYNGVQFFDDNGSPLAGGMLYQYEAGSNSVQQETYTDATASIANANPIMLDSSGRVPTEIYLINGSAYNLVLTDSNNVVLNYVDNVVGVQPAVAVQGPLLSVWKTFEEQPTYVSPTQFTVLGDYTYEFAVANRVQLYDGTTYQFATCTAWNYTAPYTQVTVQTDNALPISTNINNVAISLLVSTSMTIDAGAVAYAPTNPYTQSGTVGLALNEAAGYIQGHNTRVNTLYQVLFASGSGAYTATADSSLTTISLAQVFTIQFGGASASGVQPTLNINSIGAIPLLQYTSTGSTVNAIIIAGMISDVAYNGTAYILLNPVTSPAASSGSYAPGIQTFTSNGTFTVPAGVTSLKVTSIGGGGGGGSGKAANPLTGAPAYPGGNGGNGGVAIAVLPSVTAGTAYTVSVGAPGVAGASGIDAGNGVGAGGTGGSTSFNGVVAATGGGGGLTGITAPGANGANGTITAGQYGAGAGTYSSSSGLQGGGGSGGVYVYQILPGTAGMCVVEW